MSKVFKTETGRNVYGLIAEYQTPADIYHAAEKVRDAGYSKWDVYSPFPVHGMDEAMGLRPTRLPVVVAFVGLSMAVVGFLFQLFVRTDFALIHQGKPAAAWQVLVPITFEIGVLFTAFAALIGMLVFNGLPPLAPPADDQ